MNDSLVPETLDIRKAFVGQTVIEGLWPVRKMARLQGYLSSDAGQARARLTFSRDRNWRYIIEGEVSATVEVTCERCLESFPLSLSEVVRLAVVESEGLAERLPEEIDPWLTAAETLSVPDLIEEQLILGMPIVARHEDTGCMPAEQRDALQATADKPGSDRNQGQGQGQGQKETGEQGADSEADNPFAILETLKKTDR
ncbi:MAG: YceD family protein [Pseudohongiellaceae bacterium]